MWHFNVWRKKWLEWKIDRSGKSWLIWIDTFCLRCTQRFSPCFFSSEYFPLWWKNSMIFLIFYVSLHLQTKFFLWSNGLQKSSSLRENKGKAKENRHPARFSICVREKSKVVFYVKSLFFVLNFPTSSSPFQKNRRNISSRQKNSSLTKRKKFLREI